MSHPLKKLEKKAVVTASIRQSQPKDINRCDSSSDPNSPAKSPANPEKCRTLREPDPLHCRHCDALLKDGICSRSKACLEERTHPYRENRREFLGRSHTARLGAPV